VCIVTDAPVPSWTVSPSTSWSSSSVVAAIRSMTLSLRASSAVMLVAVVTNDSATSALRP
jgi:hypothetical protein